MAPRDRGAGGRPAALRSLGGAPCGETPPCPWRPTPRARGLDRGRLTAGPRRPGPHGPGRGAARGRAPAPAVDRDGRAAAIFASAPSQNEFLAALRADPAIPWERVTAFHLDDTSASPRSIPRRSDASCGSPLRPRAGAALPWSRRTRRGPAAECARYAALLRARTPALAILGHGGERPSRVHRSAVVRLRRPEDVRVVELDEACRHQQVHDGAFARSPTCPQRARSPSRS